MSNKAKRIQTLARNILKAKVAYYTTGNPIMTDLEYDLLERRLGWECPNHPILNMVGYDINNQYKNPSLKEIEELIEENNGN